MSNKHILAVPLICAGIGAVTFNLVPVVFKLYRAESNSTSNSTPFYINWLDTGISQAANIGIFAGFTGAGLVAGYISGYCISYSYLM